MHAKGKQRRLNPEKKVEEEKSKSRYLSNPEPIIVNFPFLAADIMKGFFFFFHSYGTFHAEMLSQDAISLLKGYSRKKKKKSTA